MVRIQIIRLPPATCPNCLVNDLARSFRNSMGKGMLPVGFIPNGHDPSALTGSPLHCAKLGYRFVIESVSDADRIFFQLHKNKANTKYTKSFLYFVSAVFLFDFFEQLVGPHFH